MWPISGFSFRSVVMAVVAAAVFSTVPIHAIDNEFFFGGSSHIAFVVDSLTVSDAGGVVDYQDSDRDFGCAGYPEQLVVPELRSLIRSPMIDLTRDIAGNPLVGTVDSVRWPLMSIAIWFPTIRSTISGISAVTSPAAP